VHYRSFLIARAARFAPAMNTKVRRRLLTPAIIVRVIRSFREGPWVDMEFKDEVGNEGQGSDEAARQESLLAPAEILEGLPDAVVAAERDGRIVFVNAVAEQLFGYSREDLVGRPVQTLWPERVRDRYTRNMELYFATEHPMRFSTEAWGVRKDGSEFVGEMSWGIVQTSAGPLLLAVGRDVSERRAAEARVRHAAVHDPLTGLANRILLRDRLEHALARSQREGGQTGVLFIDLDNFKQVNDAHGHAAGDAVLAELGRRLMATVRPADTVARLGGDEFVVVCEQIDRGTALALGQRLKDAIERALHVRGAPFRLSASIGVALGHADGDALVANADAAVYRAKAAGGGRVEVFR
jgi:diguanylate cyclase (GGDEF)-like protein/PAS domain S-box-containing protein